MKAKKPADFELAPGITVRQFQLWRDHTPPDREKIASMVRLRFESRFLAPVMSGGRVQGGFAAVALGCLAMQALDSFRAGKPDGNTAAALRRFIRDNPEFVLLRGHEQKFYNNVRNALHHQAETQGGWRIHRSGILFDKEFRIIGAQAFMEALLKALVRYCTEIARSDDESRVWINLLTKMEHVVKACDAEEGTTTRESGSVGPN